MRVYSPTTSNCFEKGIKNKTNLMQRDNNASKQKQHNYHDERELWSLPIKRSYFFAFILVTLFMQHYVTAAATNNARISSTLDGVTKGFKSRMRSPKIANIHALQAASESLPKNQHSDDNEDEPAGSANSVTGGNHTKLLPDGKFEIRSVSGEPNYKSVNLTWEVEFVPSPVDAITNSSREVEPPLSFQVFFCEIQSFGPHRCRSKVVNGNTSLQLYDNVENDLEDMDQVRQIRQYTTQVDNLRMATKYSFHIRSTPKRKNMKVTGRSEVFDNEIEVEDFLSHNIEQGQTIVIPTKGFSAQATKCLPTASEIEVETGPYFGGKIVVDGGNCGIKGDPNNAMDKYIMRIDHKTCGSMVKPETNTVETFITVQENLGIFTHSTRRFVVVCSYQSGLQTVRASFSVPGRGGAAAVQQEHYEEEERRGRGLKPMRYVDKSALVLKEKDTTENNAAFEETEAMVEEMDSPTISYNNTDAADAVTMDDTTNVVATLENIIPGKNEEHIKQQTEVNENEIQKNNDKQQESEIKHSIENSKGSSEANTVNSDSNSSNNNNNNNDDSEVDDEADVDAELEKFSAKFAKLTADLSGRLQNEAGEDDSDDFGETPTGRGFSSGFELISFNIGSVLLTVLLSVILIGIFMYVLYRETNLTRPTSTSTTKSSNHNQQHHHHHQHQHKHLHEVNTLPRTLANKQTNNIQDVLA